MLSDDAVNRARITALHRWQHPFADFASGHDRRTSDAALVELFYGGLAHAAAHDWLNAGRRLIDKTYIDMLWHVQHLTAMRAVRPDQIAASLDDFIRDTVAPQWPMLWSLSKDASHALAVEWVERLALAGFGSLHSELAASRLLFYLCPMLPLWNLSTGHRLGLQRLANVSGGARYRDHADAATAVYAELSRALAKFATPRGLNDDNSPAHAAVQRVLDDSDWWQRRVFDQLLRDQLSSAEMHLLGCTDGGQLVVNALPSD